MSKPKRILAHEFAQALLKLPNKSITLLPLGFEAENMELAGDPARNLGGEISVYVKLKDYGGEDE